MRLLPCLLLSLLVGCTATPAPRGEVKGAKAESAELAQSDTNRLATLAMRDNLNSLLTLADKLYRRNPHEWRRGVSASRAEAVAKLQAQLEEGKPPWSELQGKRDIAALSMALASDFPADRVAALTLAMADMLITAHGGKTQFYLLDGLDAQAIYNAARNVEIAVWMLANRHQASGQPLLLADEISAQGRNLSYEREFGKIIGRLDVLSEVVTEKYRRAAIGYVQNLLGAPLLQFLPVH